MADYVVIGAGSAMILLCIARVFDRAKRIWVEGENLRIYDYRQTVTVPLRNIDRVQQTPFFRPHRVCIHFREPTVFGSQVSFFPYYCRLSTSSQHPVVAELRERAGLTT